MEYRETTELIPGINDSRFEYLQSRIESLLLKLGINPDTKKFKFQIIPENSVPACYVPGLDVVWIDPVKAVNYSEEALAHILYHESLHMGLAIPGHKIIDEALTDMITELKLRKIYPYTTFRSGYSGIVDDLISFLPNVTFEEMESMIEDDESESLDFETILWKLATADVFKYDENGNFDIEQGGVYLLDSEAIDRKLRYRWDEITELFPRLGWKFLGMDPLEHPELLHSPVRLPLNEGIIDKVLKRIKEIVAKNSGLLLKLNNQIIEFARINSISFEQAVNELGLDYLVEYFVEI